MVDPGCHPRFPDCTGVLVAGGQASRLGGVPKGLLQLDGEPLVARAVALFRDLFAEALVVANDAAAYGGFGARVVPDAFAARGAPGGLHAALAAARTEWVFTAACDMPFLSADRVAALAAERAGASAVAVMWGGRLEPLHAFWSRACLPTVTRMLAAGEPSMWQLATAVGARVVPEARWREVDPEGRAFANANTPEDLARLGLALP